MCSVCADGPPQATPGIRLSEIPPLSSELMDDVWSSNTLCSSHKSSVQTTRRHVQRAHLLQDQVLAGPVWLL